VWWRRISWAHLGAVVGALAAIGGLVFTAVATYYSAAVAEDQLEQSRKDAEKATRDQASRVSFWTVGENHTEVHVLNRSQDPLTAARLFGEFGFALRSELPKDHTVPFYLDLDSLPPCTEVVLKPDHFVVTLKDGERLHLKQMVVGLFSYVDLEFIDRDGKSWLRTNAGLYGTPELRNPEVDYPDGVMRYLAKPLVKEAPSCTGQE
jgi:hypothetical protein